MPFNLGIALGAGMSSAVNTYTKMNEDARQQQEAAYRAQEQADKINLANAYSESQKPNQVQAFNPDATKALDEQGGGPAVTNTAVPLSRGEQQAKFEKLAAEYKIDPLKIQQASLASYQLGKVKREDDVEEKIYKLKTQQTDDYTTLAGLEHANDVPGMLKTYGQRYKESTGHDVILNDKGNLVITDSKGKVLHEQPGDAKSVASAIGGTLQSHYKEQLGILDPNYGLKNEELGIKRKEADDKGVYMRGMVGAANARASNAGRSFIDKLPEKEKFQLNSLNSGVQIAAKAFEANPTPEGELRVGKAQLKLNMAMKKHDLIDDIYEGTGIPSPQDAAYQMMGNKALKPADIQKRIDVARQQFGRDYADEVALALKLNAPVNTKPSAIPVGSNSTSAAPKNLPRGQAIASNQMQSQRTRAAQNSSAE